jgi:TP901 family phage tail tape measure protein
MSDIAKVVDGMKDSNGKTTKSYDDMADSIVNLSKKIPMTTTEIGQIIASAGQAGIAKNELVGFAEDAAKMGIAFDTTAQQAGDWMAQWRTSLNLTQKGVVNLADQINYLGNTSSEKAGKLSQIVTDIGSLGKMAGLSGGQVAALGAATTGVDASVASTGIKSLITSLTAGSSATAKQQKVLSKLGMTSTGVAKGMQKNAEGTIMSVLRQINKLPKAEQAAAIKDYFGKQSLQTVSKLAGNVKNLKDQFDKVADSTKYAGSMEKEYEARAATTRNSLQLLKNNFNAIKIQLGTAMLPAISKVANLMSLGLQQISKGIKFISPYVSKFFKQFAAGGTVANKYLKPIAVQLKKLWQNISPILIIITKLTFMVIKALAKTIWPMIKVYGKYIAGTIKNLLKILNGLIEFITGVFTGNWKKAWQGVKDVFAGIFGQIWDAAKLPLNLLISGVNTLIAGLNHVSIHVPKWVPKVGGKTFGINIPQIPMLAEGGIATKPTIAMIAEGNEPEAVMPLSKLKGNGGNVFTFSPTIEIKGNADKEKVKEALAEGYEEFVKYMKKYEAQNKRTKFA